MAKTVTTLFVKDDQVNLFVMRDDKVHNWATLPLDPGWVTQGIIRDEEKAAARIRVLFDTKKASDRGVVVGVNGRGSLYRLVTLPEVPEAMLDAAVRQEARRVIQAPLDDMYLSYQVLPAPKGEKRIFLVACPRSNVDALLNTLKKADIRPDRMDMAPLALCRVANESRAILVNYEMGQLNVVVVAERIPQVVRSVDLPENVAYPQERFNAIADELARTVTFYNSSHMEKPIDRNVPVLVSGELAKAEDSWPIIVGRTKYPISRLPSPVQIPDDIPVNDFLVNVGLALNPASLGEGSNASIVNINAMPMARPRKPVNLFAYLVPAAGAVAIAFLVYMFLGVQAIDAQTDQLRSQQSTIQNSIDQQNKAMPALKTQLSTLQTQASGMDPQIAKAQGLAAAAKANLDGLNQRTQQVNSNLTQMVTMARNLVTNSLSTPVDLVKIDYQADAVNLTGIVLQTGTPQDDSAIIAYARALQNSHISSTVAIADIKAMDPTTAGETFLQFQIVLR